jgi:hypothetical protein
MGFERIYVGKDHSESLVDRVDILVVECISLGQDHSVRVVDGQYGLECIFFGWHHNVDLVDMEADSVRICSDLYQSFGLLDSCLEHISFNYYYSVGLLDMYYDMKGHLGSWYNQLYMMGPVDFCCNQFVQVLVVLQIYTTDH